MRLDCDGDTLLVKVDQEGPACHTGTRTCFDDRPAARVPVSRVTGRGVPSGPTVLLGLAGAGAAAVAGSQAVGRRRPADQPAAAHGSRPAGPTWRRSPAALGAGGAGLLGRRAGDPRSGPPRGRRARRSWPPRSARAVTRLRGPTSDEASPTAGSRRSAGGRSGRPRRPPPWLAVVAGVGAVLAARPSSWPRALRVRLAGDVAPLRRPGRGAATRGRRRRRGAPTRRRPVARPATRVATPRDMTSTTMGPRMPRLDSTTSTHDRGAPACPDTTATPRRPGPASPGPGRLRRRRCRPDARPDQLLFFWSAWRSSSRPSRWSSWPSWAWHADAGDRGAGRHRAAGRLGCGGLPARGGDGSAAALLGWLATASRCTCATLTCQGRWGSARRWRSLGIHCPGCGGLRAVNDLTHGDLVGRGLQQPAARRWRSLPSPRRWLRSLTTGGAASPAPGRRTGSAPVTLAIGRRGALHRAAQPAGRAALARALSRCRPARRR